MTLQFIQIKVDAWISLRRYCQEIPQDLPRWVLRQWWFHGDLGEIGESEEVSEDWEAWILSLYFLSSPENWW